LRNGNASGPVIRCFVIGVRSNTAQALRMAAYSSASSKYTVAVV
jgi:hypothetical protein